MARGKELVFVETYGTLKKKIKIEDFKRKRAQNHTWS